jgi:uncharacterized protein YebE (UPF0316 family)
MLAAVDLTHWVLIPFLIFCARVLDVSIGTLRIILISRGHRVLAPLLGAAEVFVWLLAAGKILGSGALANVACYVGYCGGFALGNYVGMIIEGRIALGTVLLRIISRKDTSLLAVRLREDGLGVTEIAGEGATGPVHILFTLLPRRELPQVATVVRQYEPAAFYSVEDVRSVEKGVFPATAQRPFIAPPRKGK